MEQSSGSLGQGESGSMSSETAELLTAHEPRDFAGSKVGPLDRPPAGGHSQGPKDPPERWGEFFARTGAGSGGRGVGGKGVKRHPSTGEDVVIRSGARFSPPARGFGSSRGFPRARSPDDVYPPTENMSRKGRSMVLERGFNDLRGRRGSAPLSNSGGHGPSRGEKHGGGENRGLWPLVVGLQGEGQESWRLQVGFRTACVGAGSDELLLLIERGIHSAKVTEVLGWRSTLCLGPGSISCWEGFCCFLVIIILLRV